jgi:hypothetical protein
MILLAYPLYEYSIYFWKWITRKSLENKVFSEYYNVAEHGEMPKNKLLRITCW